MDWDGDGRPDLLAGNANGTVILFRNVGTGKAVELAAGIPLQAAGKTIEGPLKINAGVISIGDIQQFKTANKGLAKNYSFIHAGDWNSDGLLDLLVGSKVNLVLYKNIGMAGQPVLTAPVDIHLPDPIDWEKRAPYLYDWNGDGKSDLLIGSNELYVFLNIDTRANPVFGKRTKIELDPDEFRAGYENKPTITDWNNDGKPDLLIGNTYLTPQEKERGTVWLFLQK